MDIIRSFNSGFLYRDLESNEIKFHSFLAQKDIEILKNGFILTDKKGLSYFVRNSGTVSGPFARVLVINRELVVAKTDEEYNEYAIINRQGEEVLFFEEVELTVMCDENITYLLVKDVASGEKRIFDAKSFLVSKSAFKEIEIFPMKGYAIGIQTGESKRKLYELSELTFE